MTEPLHAFLLRQAERAPDRVAIVDGERRVRYGELARWSERLASLLRGAGCDKGDRVGLLLPKSAAAIGAMHAVLRAGGIYVPLDPQSPAARLRRIVESSEPRLVLADGTSWARAAELDALCGGLRLGLLDRSPEAPGPRPLFDAGDLDSATSVVGAPSVSDSDPAHILFTSGSTGTPKGVVITHGSVRAFVEWANGYFGAGPEDRNSAHSPLFFDLSTYDIYGTLHAGAELHLVPPHLNLLPHKLAAFIRDHELTQWFSVPSILSYLARFDAVAPGDFPRLRRLLWCGEVFPTPSLRYWMSRLPHVQFTNLYGPTEATIASSFYTVERAPEDDREPVPIGWPCGGEELLVLDEALQSVPPGGTGEIYIAGAGLSPGYWNDPETTARAFLPDPRNPGSRIYRTGDLGRVDERGRLVYLGRADSQIKSRGYRIELGEIESALNSLGLLSECAVVAVPTDDFEGQIVCCAYASERESLTPQQLRGRLTELLPSYMIPARWKRWAELPKTANGKTDRKRLREDFAEAAHSRR